MLLVALKPAGRSFGKVRGRDPRFKAQPLCRRVLGSVAASPRSWEDRAVPAVFVDASPWTPRGRDVGKREVFIKRPYHTLS